MAKNKKKKNNTKKKNNESVVIEKNIQKSNKKIAKELIKKIAIWLFLFLIVAGMVFMYAFSALAK